MRGDEQWSRYHVTAMHRSMQLGRRRCIHDGRTRAYKGTRKFNRLYSIFRTEAPVRSYANKGSNDSGADKFLGDKDSERSLFI